MGALAEPQPEESFSAEPAAEVAPEQAPEDTGAATVEGQGAETERAIDA